MAWLFLDDSLSFDFRYIKGQHIFALALPNLLLVYCYRKIRLRAVRFTTVGRDLRIIGLSLQTRFGREMDGTLATSSENEVNSVTSAESDRGGGRRK